MFGHVYMCVPLELELQAVVYHLIWTLVLGLNLGPLLEQ